MMEAKRFLNFVQSGNTFVARLPIPEHNEAQPANAAVGFGVAVGGLAQYLHVRTSKAAEAFLGA